MASNKNNKASVFLKFIQCYSCDIYCFAGACLVPVRSPYAITNEAFSHIRTGKRPATARQGYYFILLNASFTTISTARSGFSLKIWVTTFADGAGEKPSMVRAETASSLTAVLIDGPALCD